MSVYSLDLNSTIYKIVSTRRKQNHQKTQFSQINGTLNDFVIPKNIDASVVENGTLEPQTTGRFNNSERNIGGEDGAGQNQVNNSNIDDKIRKAVANAVMTVENRMHDAILTAMDKVVNLRVEIAMRSITGSTGHGP